MPKSKTRRPAKPARPTRSEAPLSPEKELERKTLALVEASLETVREAERGIGVAAWKMPGLTSPEFEKAREVHDLLRAAALGLLTAYSRLANLPDPRLGVTTKREGQSLSADLDPERVQVLQGIR